MSRRPIIAGLATAGLTAAAGVVVLSWRREPMLSRRPVRHVDSWVFLRRGPWAVRVTRDRPDMRFEPGRGWVLR